MILKYTGLIRFYFRRYAKKEPLQGKQYLTEGKIGLGFPLTRVRNFPLSMWLDQ